MYHFCLKSNITEDYILLKLSKNNSILKPLTKIFMDNFCTYLFQESGVNLTLTVVDTPGFGDAIDNSDCWDPVLHYVESRVTQTDRQTDRQIDRQTDRQNDRQTDRQTDRKIEIQIIIYFIKYFQYEEFLEAETKVLRNPNMADTRVHACLYFIAPTGNCTGGITIIGPLKRRNNLCPTVQCILCQLIVNFSNIAI